MALRSRWNPWRGNPGRSASRVRSNAASGRSQRAGLGEERRRQGSQHSRDHGNGVATGAAEDAAGDLQASNRIDLKTSSAPPPRFEVVPQATNDQPRSAEERVPAAPEPINQWSSRRRRRRCLRSCRATCRASNRNYRRGPRCRVRFPRDPGREQSWFDPLSVDQHHARRRSNIASTRSDPAASARSKST